MKRGTCTLPPRGWWCSLERGHDGPCPTRPKWWNVMFKITGVS